MARIMAIDYGTKRVGIAVTDKLKLISTGLTTVHSKDIVQFLKKYFSDEDVECIVVGLPKRLNNLHSETTELVLQFIKNLKRTFPEKKIETIDERLTSKMATDSMLAGGLKKESRKNKELIDEISAVIILQNYMMSIGK